MNYSVYPSAGEKAERMEKEKLYLDLLKKTLLNDIYFDMEFRLLYAVGRHLAKLPVDGEVIRDIRNKHTEWFQRANKQRVEGRPWWLVDVFFENQEKQRLDLRNYCEFAHTMVGRKRIDNIEFCLDSIREDGIPGDLAETGVWRGGSVIFMRGYLKVWEMEGRKVWVADSFEGLPKPSLPEDAGWDYSKEAAPILAIPLEEVKNNFDKYGLLDDSVCFLKGWFKDTLPEAPIGKLALLRLDGDLYESTMDALTSLYDKVSPGGYVIVDDYGDFEPCKRAVDEFRQARGITEPLVTIDWAGSYWRKEGFNPSKKVRSGSARPAKRGR